MAIWNILLTFGIFYDHLVMLWQFWYIFQRFGIVCQEKSGSPGWMQSQRFNANINFERKLNGS
jgi:hypothetical protein